MRTIEFVFGFGNAKNLLLLLKSYLSEFDILNFSAILFGQFPVIAFETYAFAFSFLFTVRFFQSTFLKYLFNVCHKYRLYTEGLWKSQVKYVNMSRLLYSHIFKYTVL